MKVTKGIITVVVAFLYWLLYQLWLPTLSLAYVDGFLFIGLGVVLAATLVAMWISGEDEYKIKIPGFTLAGFIGLLIFCSIAGSALFNSTAMHTQIGEIEERDFKNDVLELDTSQIPVVDLELAAKLADKKLGEDLALGSQMKVGTFTNKQQVNGKLVYVAPLEHRDIFKWNSNKSGTIGYVVVSATNPNDVTLVKTVNDKPLHLKYLSSAFFSSDLTRHLRDSGYRNIGLNTVSNLMTQDIRIGLLLLTRTLHCGKILKQVVLLFVTRKLETANGILFQMRLNGLILFSPKNSLLTK